MSDRVRYHPAGTFPPYSFLPALNPHPNGEGGYRQGVDDPIAEPIDLDDSSRNECLRFSIDLFNHEFFWESHVYLEALWNAHERKGKVADLMKALVKLSAAGVKLKTSQDATAHLHRATSIFNELMQTEGRMFLGFDLQQLLDGVATTLRTGVMFSLHPHWKEFA